MVGTICFMLYPSLQGKIEVQKKLISEIKADVGKHKKISDEVLAVRKARSILEQKSALIKKEKEAGEATATQLAAIIALIPEKHVHITGINFTPDTVLIEGYTYDVCLFEEYVTGLERSKWIDGYRFETPEIAMRDRKKRVEFKLKFEKPKQEPKDYSKKKGKKR